jgi:hypothetical protein
VVLAGDDGLLRDGTITKPKQNLKKNKTTLESIQK